MKNLRIVLSQEDFKKLVAGKEVNVPGADIILSDIGFHKMEECLDEAMQEYVNKVKTGE